MILHMLLWNNTTSITIVNINTGKLYKQVFSMKKKLLCNIEQA